MLNELRAEQMSYFNIKPKSFNTKYKKLNVDCIYSLIFIISYLEIRGFTLSHICLSDFEIYENHIFLKDDEHVVQLVDDYYMYDPRSKTNTLEFLPPTNSRNYKTYLYKSVGQFMFWVLTHTNVEMNEKNLEPYYYTKPYFFIKNTMSTEPTLIYL
jgi:hypothetical protein